MTITYDKFDSVDLRIQQGDDESFTFTVTSGGVAVDFTGATITAKARKSIDDAETVFSISIVDGSGSTFNQGILRLTLSDTVTDKIPQGSVYDIKSTLSGVTTTIVRGKLNVYKTVTR